MNRSRLNWAALALAAMGIGAFVCLVGALFAREGHVFTSLLAAALGIAGSGAYAVFALRQAEARIAKLSDELTAQSRRLLRLEDRLATLPADAETSLDRHVDELKQATGALADALDGQNERLRRLESQPVAAAAPPAVPEPAVPPPPAPQLAVPPPATPEPAVPAPSPPPRLASREDFARAASAILGKLAPDSARPAPAPADDAIVADVEAGRLELWLEPIVTLPQRRLRLYAARPHLRGHDDRTITASTIRPALVRRGRLGRLDVFTLSQGLLVATHLAERGRDGAVCVALSREALGSPSFLDGAAARLGADRAAAARLVVEVDAADTGTMSAQEAAGLERLRALGIGLALGRVADLDQDWAALARRGFGYALVEVATIMAPRPHATTAFLIAEALRAGIMLVAVGVEREPEVPDLLDFDVPLACGPALAPARAVRPEAFEPSVRSEPEPAPDAPDGRATFRDFLRRVG